LSCALDIGMGSIIGERQYFYELISVKAIGEMSVTRQADCGMTIIRKEIGHCYVIVLDYLCTLVDERVKFLRVRNQIYKTPIDKLLYYVTTPSIRKAMLHRYYVDSLGVHPRLSVLC
jgi:hypothetical protein